MARSVSTRFHILKSASASASRRSLLWILPLVLWGAAVPAKDEAHPQRSPVPVEAPDDVYVSQVMAPDGHVDATTVLMVLDSPMLRYWRISLDEQRAQIDQSEQKYKDGLADEQQHMLDAKAAKLTAAMNASHAKWKAVNANLVFGVGSKIDTSQALRDASADESASLEATSNAKQGPLKRAEDLALIAKKHEKLKAQEDLYQMLVSHLTVKAGVAGTFASSVGQGSFVKKGHPLGEIRP